MARKSSPQTTLKVTLPAGSDANALLMMQLRLSDRVALRYQDMGVNGEFFIEGHTLEAGLDGGHFERTLLLRQA